MRNGIEPFYPQDPDTVGSFRKNYNFAAKGIKNPERLDKFGQHPDTLLGMH